ncbi:MAG: hypothetical protein AAFR55_02040, partial [Pseudomonadota bacterium]
MAVVRRHLAALGCVGLAFSVVVTAPTSAAFAQSEWRGTITDLLEGRWPKGDSDKGDQTERGAAQPNRRVAEADGNAKTPAAPGATGGDTDPRAGDKAYEQAKRLMRAIDRVLNDTARNRGEAAKLPSKNDFIIPPVWTETKEERQSRIRDLLDSALGIVTDVP